MLTKDGNTNREYYRSYARIVCTIVEFLLWAKFLTTPSLALHAVTVRTRSLAFLTVPLVLYIVSSALNRRVQLMICEPILQSVLLQPITAGRCLDLKIELPAFRHVAYWWIWHSRWHGKGVGEGLWVHSWNVVRGTNLD